MSGGWWRRRVSGLALAGAACVVMAASAGAAPESTIERFAGQWRGATIEVDGSEALGHMQPGDLDFELEVDADGFHARWTALERNPANDSFERQRLAAAFVASDRPGVYVFDETSDSSLFERLFASPNTANPLEGQTLLWARVEDATLIIYSLTIGHRGGFDLDRYARTLTDQGLRLEHQHRMDDVPVITITGQLEPKE